MLKTTDTAPVPSAGELESALYGHLSELLELRYDLHRNPCLSGDEADSAERVKNWLGERLEQVEFVEELGGTGLAAVIDSGHPGSTVILRAELDALPMNDWPELPHASTREGIAHKCGHDGHSVIISAVGLLLRQFPLPGGRVVLLYQPAEETGQGARQVLADPRFPTLSADWAFGLHNVPGLPMGQIQYRVGPLCPASEGFEVRIVGAPSHASEPHKGRNPALAIAQILSSFAALPAELGGLNSVGLITPTSIQMGRRDFGISPGEAELCFTVRAETTSKLQALVEVMRRRAGLIASHYDLQLEFKRHDPFPATVNTPEGAAVLKRAFRHLEFPTERPDTIFPWSEDFGEFLVRIPGAFFALGAGLDHPPLHSHEYDFPDQVISRGAVALYTVAWMAATSDRAGV